VLKRGYEKLPPIVIQGSYTLPKNLGSFYDEGELEENINSCIENIFFSESS